jgi:tetratricopeptide (TPR) repeat protein
MNCDPTDAAAPFNLGNMFRATGRKIEAEAALRAATRADPMFAEAWYNLSDLQRGSRHKEAAECWRQYLANDAQSEWAARARRSLKFCEMQIHLSAS